MYFMGAESPDKILRSLLPVLFWFRLTLRLVQRDQYEEDLCLYLKLTSPLEKSGVFSLLNLIVLFLSFLSYVFLC